MNRQRGWGTYLVLIVVLIVLFMYLPSVMNQSESVSNTAYEEMLENGEIVSATIEQNQETPTGSIQFQTEDGATGRVNVSDVVEAENELKAQGVTITVNSVSGTISFLPDTSCTAGWAGGDHFHVHDEPVSRRRQQYQCQDDEFRQKQSQKDNGSGQKSIVR